MFDQFLDILDELNDELTDLSCNLTLEQCKAAIESIKPFFTKDQLDAFGKQLYDTLNHD